MKKLLLLFFIFLIPIIFLTAVDNYFSQKSDVYITQEVTSIISDVIGETLTDNKTFKNSNQILNCKYDTEGKINTIYIDTVIINEILSNTNLTLTRLLSEGTIEASIRDIKLPLGMLVSKSLFTTLGPDINIEVLPVTSYKTDIVTTLVDYGINNSIFETYLKIEIVVETIIPLKQSKINYETQILLASQIVQGEVPYYYYMGEGSIQSLPL